MSELRGHAPLKSLIKEGGKGEMNEILVNMSAESSHTPHVFDLGGKEGLKDRISCYVLDE